MADIELIVKIPEEMWERIKDGYVPLGISKYLQNGTPIPDNATPCDFCRYNPPSSTDGKPCCMCPATGRGE